MRDLTLARSHAPAYVLSVYQTYQALRATGRRWAGGSYVRGVGVRSPFRSAVMLLRDWRHGFEDPPGPLLIHDWEVEFGATRARRVLVLTAEPAREQATGERAPDEQ